MLAANHRKIRQPPANVVGRGRIRCHTPCDTRANIIELYNIGKQFTQRIDIVYLSSVESAEQGQS